MNEEQKAACNAEAVDQLQTIEDLIQDFDSGAAVAASSGNQKAKKGAAKHAQSDSSSGGVKAKTKTKGVANVVTRKPSRRAFTPEEIAEKRKENMLGRIRAELLARVENLRHVSRSELKELQEVLQEKLADVGLASSAHGVRGSHTVAKLTDGTHSVGLMHARRPQKDGYAAGTVRTIIRGWLDKVMTVVAGGMEESAARDTGIVDNRDQTKVDPPEHSNKSGKKGAKKK